MYRFFTALSVFAFMTAAAIALADECATPDADRKMLKATEAVAFAELSNDEAARALAIIAKSGVAAPEHDALFGVLWPNGHLSVGLFSNGCRVGIINDLIAELILKGV